MTARKVDNSHTIAKLVLRRDMVLRIGKPRVRVLDAFHGTGHIWNTLARLMPDVSFDVLGIDKRKVGPRTLRGDNVRIMPSLDLPSFDLIDLDAYGIPYEQLEIVSRYAPGVPVACTCIGSNLRGPISMIRRLGMPEHWSTRAPALWNAHADEFWSAYLYGLGFRHATSYRWHDPIGIKRYEALWYT